jgi:hypothetical protein
LNYGKRKGGNKMGLDMFLEGKEYIEPKSWPRQPGELTYKIYELGYWRKANAIHWWFVENVQNGEDDCREYYVSLENLHKLRDTCEAVLATLEKSPMNTVEEKVGWSPKTGPLYEKVPVYTDTELAKELLPTESGFFFGPIFYDDYYKQQLERTILICAYAINWGKKQKDPEIYYQSSW